MNSLPTIQLNGKTYFIDYRLRQFRMCNNPHNYFSFDTLKDEGDFFTIKFIKDTDNEIAGNGMYEYGTLIECEIPAFALLPQKRTFNKN